MTNRLTRLLAPLIVLVLILVVFQGAAPTLMAGGQLGAREPEAWIKLLDAPGRVAGLRVDEIVSRLGLKPGQVVVDLGAGTGVFSLPMARAVGPTGRVYAVDIEQGLVDYIGQKAKDQGVANIQPLLGQPADPSLPVHDVDLAFMHDVLHHIADRQAYLKAAAGYMKTGGRFAIVELDPKTGPHRNDPTLQITRAQLDTMMAAAGLTVAEQVDMFDDKYVVIYTKR